MKPVRVWAVHHPTVPWRVHDLRDTLAEAEQDRWLLRYEDGKSAKLTALEIRDVPTRRRRARKP